MNATGGGPDSRNRTRSAAGSATPSSLYSGNPPSRVCTGQSGCRAANQSGNAAITRSGEWM
ncbi:MAG: hypothetical protein EBX36_08855 [Planctomycetia bacterium]|nr:hypothetical protein [Planctomycetia bacterium]